MSKKLFTSDLHFFHNKIVEFTNRKEVTTQENHEEWLLDLWNKTVNKGDIVYILGDLSFAKDIATTEKYLKKLHGQKIVIKGNHDKSKDLEVLQNNNTIVKYTDYSEIRVNSEHICMFHFPISSWHKQRFGSWHLHGHSHGNFAETKGKMLDVGIDSAYNILGEHRLFTFEDIASIMSSKQIVVNDTHR